MAIRIGLSRALSLLGAAMMILPFAVVSLLRGR
jgi:hypothetical protein